MKRLFSVKSVLCVLALGSGLMAAPAWAELKVGVVDFSRLLEESPQAKTANEAMRNEFAPRQRELQTQQQALKAKEDKLSKDGATMTEDQRARADKELREGAREFARKQNEFQDDLNARRNEEYSRLQKTLIEEARTYARAQSFDLVLAEGVIYFNQAIDLTPAVLAALQAHNTTSPASNSQPAAKPATPKPPGH